MNIEKIELQNFVKQEIIGKYEKSFVTEQKIRSRICPVCETHVHINQLSSHLQNCSKVFKIFYLI
jgi:hypothetical protein